MDEMASWLGHGLKGGGFLVRYIAYKNSRCKDAEEIKFSHVWEPKGDSVY